MTQNVKKIGGTLIKSEEHLPTTSVNDKQSLSRQELDLVRTYWYAL